MSLAMAAWLEIRYRDIADIVKLIEDREA